MSQFRLLLSDPRRAAFTALLAYLTFDLLLPRIALPPLAGLIALSTALFMLLQLWVVQTVVNLKPRPDVSVLLTVGFLILWIVTFLYVRPQHHWAPSQNAPYFVLRPLLLLLAITFGCTFFGILLSPIVREANVLLPVALVAMPIDYLGAMTPVGFTQNAVASNPAFVQAVSVPVPSVGGGGIAAGLHAISFIGPGDILFMAFFFAVVLRLHLNVRGTFWWMYGLLTLTMLIVQAAPDTSVLSKIAALIPMGLTMLIANHAYFHLKRDEVFATLYAGTLVLVLVTGFYLYSHSHFYHSDSKGNTDALPNSTRPAPSRPAGNG